AQGDQYPYTRQRRHVHLAIDRSHARGHRASRPAARQGDAGQAREVRPNPTERRDFNPSHTKTGATHHASQIPGTLDAGPVTHPAGTASAGAARRTRRRNARRPWGWWLRWRRPWGRTRRLRRRRSGRWWLRWGAFAPWGPGRRRGYGALWRRRRE